MTRYTFDVLEEDTLPAQFIVWYLYFNGYPFFGAESIDDTLGFPEFTLHAKVHDLAAKTYQLPELASLSEVYFEQSLYNHSVRILRTQFILSIEKLQPWSPNDFLDSFKAGLDQNWKDCFRDMFKKRPRSLRTATAKAVLEQSCAEESTADGVGSNKQELKDEFTKESDVRGNEGLKRKK